MTASPAADAAEPSFTMEILGPLPLDIDEEALQSATITGLRSGNPRLQIDDWQLPGVIEKAFGTLCAASAAPKAHEEQRPEVKMRHCNFKVVFDGSKARRVAAASAGAD